MAETIELDLAWEFAPEDDFGFADLARDYFSKTPRWPSRRARCSACTRRRITSAAQAGAASRRRPQKSCSKPWPPSRRKRPARANRRVGRRPGPGRMPAAHPRPALQNPVQARQERARIQGRGRGQPRHAHRAARSAAKAGAIDSAYQFHWKRFCSRTSPRARAFRRWAPQPVIAGRPAAGTGAGVFHRRFANH